MPDFTFWDLLHGAYTIMAEARNESSTGQLAVAAVIVNRLNRPDYFKARSVFEVVHAPLQFSCWNNSPDKNLEMTMAVPFHDKRFLTAMLAMLEAMLGSDPTNGADHYHAHYVNPNLADPSKHTITIGAHKFYKLANR